MDETFKFGVGSVMVLVLDYVSWFGVSGMELVVGRMNSKQLFEKLEVSLLPALDQVAGHSEPSSANNVIFQRDSEPKYKSIQAKIWLSSKSVSITRSKPN